MGCIKPWFEKRNDNYPQLTDHYFTGDYPVKIIDELGGDKVTQLSLLSTGSNNWWKVSFTEMKFMNQRGLCL